MKFSSATLSLLLLGATTAPTAEAFRNGNAPKPAEAVVKKPPMPFKWPIVGTLPDFLMWGGVDNMVGIYEDMYHDYGNAYATSLMGSDEFVVSDPRVMDQVLRKEGMFPVGSGEVVTMFTEYYEENEMDFAIRAVGRGPDWKEWRGELNPDFYVLWDTYLPVIAETCRKISAVAGKETTETKNLHVADFWTRAAFDMFYAVMNGESPETTNSEKAKPEDLEFVRAAKDAFAGVGALLTNPLEKVFESDLYKDFRFNMNQIVALGNKNALERLEAARTTKAAFEAEAAAKEQTDAGESSTSGCPVTAVKKAVGLGRNQPVPTDFANPSIMERLVNRDSLSTKQILETQAPLLMAGVDTTAYVMGWFYLNMASNPEVQARLAAELDAKLDGQDVTTKEQLDSLTYLKACFRESHRLTPPAPITAKTLAKDVTVVVPGDEKHDDSSYTIPGGTRISLNLKGWPMDPTLVEHPTQYMPERFLEDAVEARRGTPSAIALDHPYMSDPFGRGKRRCMGANVAVAEMSVLAARLLQDYTIELVDPNESLNSPTKSWKAKQKFMVIADPYPAMKLIPRNKNKKNEEQ